MEPRSVSNSSPETSHRYVSFQVWKRIQCGLDQKYRKKKKKREKKKKKKNGNFQLSNSDAYVSSAHFPTKLERAFHHQNKDQWPNEHQLSHAHLFTWRVFFRRWAGWCPNTNEGSEGNPGYLWRRGYNSKPWGYLPETVFTSDRGESANSN